MKQAKTSAFKHKQTNKTKHFQDFHLVRKCYTAATNVLLLLTLHNTPQHLEFFYISGRKLDVEFMGCQNAAASAHRVAVIAADVHGPAVRAQHQGGIDPVHRRKKAHTCLLVAVSIKSGGSDNTPDRFESSCRTLAWW